MRVLVRGLSKTFRSRRESVKAVDDVSLEVDDGEMLVLLGPSGSGKTTLLRCIAGLEPADAGEIWLEGRLVYSSATGVWVPPERRQVGMVFQTYALWPHMTTFDNVAYPLRSDRTSAADVEDRVARALDMVGCGHLGGRHPSELSGGQQQRVALARAIVAGNRVILFDEPLSSVDARVREELRHQIVTLQRQLGFSAVYITHDQTEAMAIGHRIAVLEEGRIVQVAAPRQLYHRPASRHVAGFVGVSNQLPGVLEDSDGTWAKVETGLGTVLAGQAPAEWAPGSDVVLVFRPDACRIEVAQPTGGRLNCWHGSVEQSIFLGYCTEYLVRCGDHVIAVRSTEQEVLESGTDVWFGVAPDDVLVVPAT